MTPFKKSLEVAWGPEASHLLRPTADYRDLPAHSRAASSASRSFGIALTWLVAKSSAAILTSSSRNLRIKDPPDVGFVTGIGAVILVGVTTQDREAPADTRDMYMVQAMFRREFAALPTLVRGVAAADAERVDLIAEHTGLLTAVLEAHHRAEDTHLWPTLLDGAEEDLGPVAHVMEEQHERIEQLTAQAVVELGEWREDPAAERRIRLAGAAVFRSGAPRDESQLAHQIPQHQKENSNDS